ncbi:MAG: SDR family oxidoreductase [Parvibaculales bacterium]
MSDFSGQTVIVTGGARGIGRGITTRFAEAGAHVVICGRSQPEAFTADIQGNITFVECDVRDPEQVIGLIQKAEEIEGVFTTLINNAGGGPPVASAEASPRLTESVIRLNLLAPIYTSQHAYKSFRANQVVGSIINISSVSAVRSSPGTVAYGAAKAGLLNVTTSLAMEWAPDVRVNAIIVGLVETEASEDHYNGAKGMAYLADNLPMKRMGKPQDIAKACLFLSDPANSYVSGACLEVFGGGEPPSFLKITEEALKL